MCGPPMAELGGYFNWMADLFGGAIRWNQHWYRFRQAYSRSDSDRIDISIDILDIVDQAGVNTVFCWHGHHVVCHVTDHRTVAPRFLESTPYTATTNIFILLQVPSNF